ncbi:MAG: hypothetical protein QME40_03610, partial [bacterium]|nr:hypothetical protein [bacterium]
YLDREYLSDTMFEAATILRIIIQSTNEEEIAKKLKELGITHILINRYYASENLYPNLDEMEKERMLEFEKRYLKEIWVKGNVYLYKVLSKKGAK